MSDIRPIIAGGAASFKPPRFVAGKVFFVLLLAYLATTVTAFFWWQAHARSRHQAEIDAVHARGEPVMVEDITFFRTLPPQKNAFTFYERAVQALDGVTVTVNGEPTAQAARDVLHSYPAYRREHADEAAAFLAACQPALDLIRQARDMDGVPLMAPSGNWPEHMGVFEPETNNPRQAVKLCQLAAAMAHDAGDDREAFEHLRDILQIRDRMGEHPTLLTSLGQIAITSLAAWTVEQIAPTLRIGDGPGEVPATEVRELAERLVRSDTLLVTARKGMTAERVNNYELIRHAITAGAGMNRDRFDDDVAMLSPFGMGLRPTMELNLARIIRYETLLGAAIIGDRYGQRFGGPTSPEDKAFLDQINVDRLHPLRQAAQYTMQMQLPGRLRYVHLLHRGLASQRMAGLALLMRVYEVENGRPIETLDDLSPRYLSTLPEDPFSPTGEPPRYLSDDLYPRLYCLGRDQQDDGGDFGSRTRRFAEEPKDWPFFLNNSRDQAEQRDEQPPPPKSSPTRAW